MTVATSVTQISETLAAVHRIVRPTTIFTAVRHWEPPFSPVRWRPPNLTRLRQGNRLGVLKHRALRLQGPRRKAGFLFGGGYVSIPIKQVKAIRIGPNVRSRDLWPLLRGGNRNTPPPPPYKKAVIFIS